MSVEAFMLGAIHELTLYAACGFALFGVDDVLVDLIWLYQFLRPKQIEVPPRERLFAAEWRPAIFIPTWQEEEVIGATIAGLHQKWFGHDYRLFVGCYPNDPLTQREVGQQLSRHVRLVILDHEGPTTKADCLNGLWTALKRYEVEHQTAFDHIILHDAEDCVDASELQTFCSCAGSADFIQLPVIPIADRHARWISGHYLDEFAEAHLKEMVVRQYVGASLPSAGTGSAIARSALSQIADARGGLPFDADSLTEDYELGLRLWQAGKPSLFVRHHLQNRRGVVAVRSHFPATLQTAVRQKTRWIIGIALAGWDRTGWRGGWAEHWMRWRDRRVIVAATLIVAGYCAATLSIIAMGAGWQSPQDEGLASLLAICLLLFLWRMMIRITCTWWQYGWAEALRAGPRVVISNIIAVMASSRAVIGYIKILRGGTVFWDKTHHSAMSQNTL
jgi:bacteriophage N4 adsorption protein B